MGFQGSQTKTYGRSSNLSVVGVHIFSVIQIASEDVNDIYSYHGNINESTLVLKRTEELLLASLRETILLLRCALMTGLLLQVDPGVLHDQCIYQEVPLLSTAK